MDSGVYERARARRAKRLRLPETHPRCIPTPEDIINQHVIDHTIRQISFYERLHVHGDAGLWTP